MNNNHTKYARKILYTRSFEIKYSDYQLLVRMLRSLGCSTEDLNKFRTLLITYRRYNNVKYKSGNQTY